MPTVVKKRAPRRSRPSGPPARKRASGVQPLHAARNAFHETLAILRRAPCTAYPELPLLFEELPDIKRLIRTRHDLIMSLAPATMKANPYNPKRNAINRARTARRREIKAALKANSAQIIQQIITIFDSALGMPEMVPTPPGTSPRVAKRWWIRARKRALQLGGTI